MKMILCLALLLLAFAANAQAPAAVPIPKEPHHHLVLENDYVRVFRVSVPGHDATLLHQHDVPYLYVSLGPADVINAVAGKPEAHLTMADGQVGYSPGHFAHIARTDAGSSFDNVTIELLQPQGEPRNICAQVASGAAEGDCPKSFARPAIGVPRRLFETGATTVGLVKLDPTIESAGVTPQLGTLIVFLGEAEIRSHIRNVLTEKVAKGDVIWVLAGSSETVWNSSRKDLSYLQLGFSGSESMIKPR